MAAKIPKNATLLKYGTYFRADADPLAIELACIARSGSWQDHGRRCGKGLPYHVKQARRLLWPDMDNHRWTDLITDTWLEKPGRTACFGPSSSSKSFTFSRDALVMFYALPHGTTVLISSTTLDALRRRIWDYVVRSDKEARQRYPWLPGSLIESKLMLLADAKTEEGRSFKDGLVAVACRRGGQWQGLSEYVGAKNNVMILVADECFPAGTSIDTPSGPRKIETLRPGDAVYNAAGIGVVQAMSERMSDQLCRIKTGNGTIIHATPKHPFLTQKGWIKACDLNQTHYMLTTHEAMRMVSNSVPTQTKRRAFLRELLRSEMVASTARSSASGETKTKEAAASMQAMRESRFRDDEHILQSQLQRVLVSFSTQMECGQSREDQLSIQEVARRTPGMASTNAGGCRCDDSRTEGSIDSQDACFPYQGWPQAEDTRWKWNGTDSSGATFVNAFPRNVSQLCHSDPHAIGQRLSRSLQGGRGVAEPPVGRGGRRKLSRNERETSSGREEISASVGTWVDRVEVLKPSDCSGIGSCGGGVRVYNLQVSGHPSYSVNGLLVHNCHFMPSGFLDSLANLESNEICYAAIMGNLPDVHNPLGMAAEPKLGWDSLPDTEKTRVYETKWKNGRCIQLIGMDSPNLDFPEGQEPYHGLIGRRYIEQCAQNYGRESDKFNMFASGKIPRASMNRTVFTKAQCIKFNASGPVTWNHTKITRGYCMDAAYSGIGGDRTCGAPFIFGLDNTNRHRFWLGPVKLFSGSADGKMSHSETIALQVKEECEAHGIDPSCVFFDGTGRSELTSAFARLWSSAIVPVEFGGPASDRPSFTGERWLDGADAGNVKTCREVFDRNVTELWFAIRHCIVADQMRGLTEELIDENCQRKWEIVRGNKYSVEPKDGQRNGEPVGMKARGLRSPDLGDMLAVGLEGARRLGFPLGKHTVPDKKNGSRWFQSMADAQWERAEKGVLRAA